VPDQASSKSDWTDAILWFAISCAVLMTAPIGFASNDGLGHSVAFATGRWRLNPNHLFFEPLGAWWQSAVMALGYPREPVDALKLLSVLSGSCAVGLFRLRIATRIARRRFEANHGTAWVAFSSAFFRLWISDETHMIQMPALIAMLWVGLCCTDRPSFRRFFSLGVTIGVAALTFISNVLVGGAIALALVIRQMRRHQIASAASATASVAGGLLVTAAPPLLLAWAKSSGGLTFFEWITRYGGEGVHARIRDAYGAGAGLSGLITASIRALYGAACAMVDITSVGAAYRDQSSPGIFAWCAALVLLASATVLLFSLRAAFQDRTDVSRAVLLVVIPATLAILLFGVFWDNSDDQFYFQLAPLAGMLVCLVPVRRDPGPSLMILMLSALCLSWNVCDITDHRIFYPRTQRIAILEKETKGACLALTPGFDEAELLLEMSHHPPPQTSVAVLASTYPYELGMPILSARIDRCLSAGKRVVFIDVFDTPRERSPWKFLRRLGYDRDSVEKALGRVPIETSSRRVGPFTFRVASGPPRSHPPFTDARRSCACAALAVMPASGMDPQP
jgi:hypothetical protein